MLALLAFLFVGHAENVSLDPIQVEDASQRASSVVTTEELEKKQARDLRDTFKDSAEVVVGGAQRAAQKVYVRSLEDTNLNVTVDGARQAGHVFRYQNRLNVDPELLKQVRVEAGTGDALAGPGALGGALRFVTKDAEDLLAPGEKWGALGKLWYHTNDSGRGASVALFGKPTESVSAVGYVTMGEQQDFRVGGGDASPYTAGRPRASLVKLAYKPTPEHKISLGNNYTSDNGQRLVRASYGVTPTSPPAQRDFATSNTTLGWDFLPTGSAHALQLDGYFTENRVVGGSGFDSTVKFKSRGFTARDTLDHKRWKLSYGGDVHADEAYAFGTTTQSGQERGTIFGAFAQGRVSVTDALTASAGARYDDYRLRMNDDQWFKGTHLNPNASLGYRWLPAWSTTVGWKQAYRGPAPVEAMLLAFATSVAPVTDLRGTVAETIDLRNEVKLAGLKTTFELSLYQTVIQNPLETSLKNNAITRYNADSDLRVRGLEFKAKRNFGDVDANVFYTRSTTKFGDGDVGYNGNFTRGASLGDRLGVGAEWRLPAERLTLNWNGTHVWKLTNVPAGAPAEPGYDLHDLSAAWFATESLRVWLTVANVLDKKYVAQGSLFAGATGVENQVYEPGRDFRLAVSYQF